MSKVSHGVTGSNFSGAQKSAIVFVVILYLYVGYQFAQKTASIPASCNDRKATASTLRQDLADCRNDVEDGEEDEKVSSSEVQYMSRVELKALVNRNRLGCSRTSKFSEYIKYKEHGQCNDDWPLAQEMMYDDACFTFGLPKRKCFAVSPKKYKERGLADPGRQWGRLWDEKVSWTKYDCKNFACLNWRKKGDCRECFNMKTESNRWENERSGKLNMSSVVNLVEGGVRIGLDVGGGSGSFAAKMSDHGAVILTTGMNTGAPFLEAISQRGLVGLHLTHESRLPFFDSSLDIVHSMHSVHILAPDKFKLMLLDWDRVLRPGGLIWLEFFYQPEDSMPPYEKALKNLKYKEHEWLTETYYGELYGKPHSITRICVVLEKPNRNAFKLGTMLNKRFRRKTQN